MAHTHIYTHKFILKTLTRAIGSGKTAKLKQKKNKNKNKITNV